MGRVIAVDGPAASGKGTLARALAKHFSLPHLDTGTLYRAVAAGALRQDIPLDDADALTGLAQALYLAHLDDPVLREGRVADAASRVSAIPGVRAALLQFQRDFARTPGGAVLDGRDIGTVIVPDAPAKLFVTAAPEIRARRRWLEFRAADAKVTEAEILADIHARDARDSGRAAAPLLRAHDADLLDTSDLGIAAAVQHAIGMVSARLDRTG